LRPFVPLRAADLATEGGELLGREDPRPQIVEMRPELGRHDAAEAAEDLGEIVFVPEQPLSCISARASSSALASIRSASRQRIMCRSAGSLGAATTMLPDLSITDSTVVSGPVDLPIAGSSTCGGVRPKEGFAPLTSPNGGMVGQADAGSISRRRSSL
jgi:hypothetical protein